MNDDHRKQKMNQKFSARLGFALAGIRTIWKTEVSFRFQFFCAVAMLAFSVYAKPPAAWCGLFTICVVLVLALECINTSLEALIDRVHPELHEQIGYAKDCLAGAVLIASIGSLIVFCLFLSSAFVPRLVSGL